MHVATISFHLNPKYKEAFYSALHPETHFSPTPQTQVQMKLEDKIVKLIFKADNVTSLRGEINSYLKCCSLIMNIFETVNQFK